jgi:hypothetical protein
MPNAPAPAAANGLPSEQPALLTDPALLPDDNGLIVTGDCMAPDAPHGAVVHVSRSQAFQPGDIVVLWKRPELVGPGETQALVKRLAMAPPSSMVFPYNEHPESEVRVLVGIEWDQPERRRGWIECRNLLAIHKVVGVRPAKKEAGPQKKRRPTAKTATKR